MTEQEKHNDNGDYFILEQWKVCVESANIISQRRDSMNNLFATLNVANVAAISFTWSLKSIMCSLGGMVICLIWLISIRYYANLNTVKFEVINYIEKSFNIKPFTREWNIISNISKDPFLKGTNIEKGIPIAFLAIYIIISGYLCWRNL